MKKIILIPALLLGTLAMANQYKYEISPMIGYNFAEGNLGLSNNGYPSGGVEFQMNFPESVISPELSIFTSVPNNGSGQGTAITRGALNGVYTFNAMSRVTPLVKVGAGYENVTKDTVSNKDGFFLDAGVGAKVAFNDNWALKLEAIYMAKFNSNNAGTADNNLLTLAGLTYSFGSNKKKEVAAVAAMATTAVTTTTATVVDDGDDDNDGVSNTNDQCIYTPAGAVVDANGCRLDDDNDGVVNSNDKCPTTKMGISVDTTGCQVVLDDDKDGISNSQDKCSNTTAGDRVDSNGCPIIKSLKVNFETNSASVANSYMTEINDYARFLKTYNNYKVNIVGYADNRGSEGYNQILSQKRAHSVKKILENTGVDANQLSWEGRGESNPVADNNTAVGQAENRRVEVEIERN